MSKLKLTNHARERMYLRGISESMIQSALDHHDKTEKEADGDIQYIKTVKRDGQNRKLHVIAMPLPEEGRDTWLIKTVWIRGEDDPPLLIKVFRMVLYHLFNRKK